MRAVKWRQFGLCGGFSVGGRLAHDPSPFQEAEHARLLYSQILQVASDLLKPLIQSFPEPVMTRFQAVEASIILRKPLIYPVETSIMLRKPLIYAVEARIMLRKPLVYAVEARINLGKPLINSDKSLVYAVKARINLGKALINSNKALIKTSLSLFKVLNAKVKAVELVRYTVKLACYVGKQTDAHRQY